MKTIIALLSALCLAAATPARAEQPFRGGGLGDTLCSPDQLSGQYECVTSTPLSEEEVRASMAYLAGLGTWQDTLPPIDVAAAKARAP